MNKIWGLGILFALLCFTRITTSQDEPHIIPSRLVFNSYSIAHETSDDKLQYVDPHQRFTKTLISFEERERPDRVYWSHDGKQLAIVIHLLGETLRNICIYSQQGQQTQCSQINLWGYHTLYYPIVWNSDNTQISFIMTAEDGTPQIGVLDLATEAIDSHPIPLFDARFFRAYWSSGGEYLLYQTESATNSESSLSSTELPYSLYLMDVKNERTQLVTNDSHDSCVAWLNDTPQFGLLTDGAFTIRGLTDNDVVTVNATYKGSDVSGCPFTFSNDNTHIAFQGVLPSQTGKGVYVTAMKDGQARLIDDGYFSVHTMIWSPDDQFIAVEVQAGTTYIKVLSLDGWKQIYSDPEGIPLVSPAWQPIG